VTSNAKRKQLGPSPTSPRVIHFSFTCVLLIINLFFLFISGGNVEQIALLCQFGAMAPLCTLLEAKEPKTILVVLDGLANILAAA
jgi:hypothetical protein